MDPGPTFNHARKMFRQELSPRTLAAYHADIERGARSLTRAFTADMRPYQFEQVIDRYISCLALSICAMLST